MKPPEGPTSPIKVEQKPTVTTEVAGKVPQSEIERVTKSWQKWVDRVFSLNRPLVERDYSTDAQIFRDLHPDKGKDYQPTEEELTHARNDTAFQTEQAKRKKEVDEGRDPLNIPTETINYFAQHIVETDTDWKGSKDPNNPDVIDEAKKRAIKHREELQLGFKTLYAIDDTRRSMESAIQRRATELQNELIEQRKKLRLEKINSERQDKGDAILDNLPDEDAQKISLSEDERQQKLIEASAEIQPQFFDRESGQYFRLDANGLPDSQNPIDDSVAYEPIHRELEIKAMQKDADGKPTSEAQEAQNMLDELQYIEEENKFRALTEDQLRENSPEYIMERLEKMRVEAMNFCTRDEFISNENLSEDAINTFAQLAVVEYVVSEPPEIREIILRQALGAYQEFRKNVAPKGKKTEDFYQDWQNVQDASSNIPDGERKIKAVTEYLQKEISVKGQWNERIGELVKNGQFSKAMVAIYSSSLVPAKERWKVLKTSKALRQAQLVKFLGKEDNPDISILNRLIFGDEEKQKKMREEIVEKYGYIFSRIPTNKWGEATKMLGGMFLITTIGKFDELMNTGVEPEGQRGSPAY